MTPIPPEAFLGTSGQDREIREMLPLCEHEANPFLALLSHPHVDLTSTAARRKVGARLQEMSQLYADHLTKVA